MNITRTQQLSPLISVIIPAYNADAFIDRTLNSVLSQTYKNLEVFVVDDGSQDRTPEIVEAFASKDARVKLLRQSNQGVAAARNLAIANSTGEYIAPIDADDIWYPTKLEKQVQCLLNSEQSVGLVYAWSVYIDEEDRILAANSGIFSYLYKLEGSVYPALVYSNFISNASVPLIRRSCFDIGGYNSALKAQNAQGCEDWDLYLRIAEAYEFKVVPEILIGYRQVTGSMSNNYISMARSYDLVMADFQQRHPEIDRAIFDWSASLFYLYLLKRSYSYGDYLKTLTWLYKVVILDKEILLCASIYKIFIKSIFKLAIKPINILLRQENRPQLQEKPSNWAIKTTDYDVNSFVSKQKIIWKPYGIVLLRRWNKVMQSCQMLPTVNNGTAVAAKATR